MDKMMKFIEDDGKLFKFEHTGELKPIQTVKCLCGGSPIEKTDGDKFYIICSKCDYSTSGKPWKEDFPWNGTAAARKNTAREWNERNKENKNV